MNHRERTKAQEIIQHLKQFPSDNYKDIAELFAVTPSYVSALKVEAGLRQRRLRCCTAQTTTVVMPRHDESEAQIAEELEQAKRRVAELERKQAEMKFHYEADSETGMFTIRQGQTTVTAHYRFWFAFLNNGEPAKARDAMTKAFCRKEAA